MVPPPEHQPQHGYPVQGREQQQQAELYQLPPPEQEEEDGSESEEQAEPTGRPNRKRRGSNNSNSESSGVQVGRGAKGRKKSKASDGRWSKRFTWPEDLHRDFVSAIFDVGLKHSSPSTILEHMPTHEQVTTERIKSHLQKYRLHRVKSKKEFLTSFESSLQNYQTNGDDGVKTVACGEVAAQLTFTALQEFSSGKGATSAASPKPAEIPNSADETQTDTPEDIMAHQQQQNSESLMLPQLTEAEKASPIGAAMGYLMGLFFSLKQQLMIQRALEAGADEKDKGNASPVQDVFNSFVAGSVPSAAPVGAAEYSGDPLLQHQQQPFDASGLGAIKPAAAQSVRTNIEENSMMKREMQNQMALQNKMRALKQQELNKYKNVNSQQEYKEEGNKMPSGAQSPLPTKEDEETAKASEAAASRGQGAGETAGTDGAVGRQHQRGLSIGASEEFWNTDVVDEQLFEFLMNN
jgi:SHAQKYF class myb-like DNA-binding protein